MDQVQIPIERNDDSWRQRCNDRVERLKAQQFPSSQVELYGEKYSLIFELEKAVQNGNVDSFVDVLEQVSSKKKLPFSALFDQVTPAGDTLLHEAAYFGREKIAEVISHHFPKLLTKTNINGDTALHVAARAKSSDVIEVILFQYEAQDKDEKLTRLMNEYGNTALHEAVSSKHLAGVTLLFNADKSVAHYQNKSDKSPLYLAVLTSNEELVDVLLKATLPNDKPLPESHGNSPLHAAIYTRNSALMREIVEKRSHLMYLRGEHGGTPFHYAAATGYLDGVDILLKKSTLAALELDSKGNLPIHLACKWGHVKVVKELLKQEWADSRVLLNKKGQNILHVAVKNGRNNVVEYLLKNTKLKQLVVNQKDKNGNTPLHLAAGRFYPKIVFYMVQEKCIDLNLTNNEGLTARDTLLVKSEIPMTRRQRVSNAFLISAGAQKSDKAKSMLRKRRVAPQVDWIKDRVNTLMLVAILIVTVTFTAGFTVPGSVYSSDDSHPKKRGMAVLANTTMFKMFVIWDTVSMYSATMGSFILLWAQFGDYDLAVRSFTIAFFMVVLALSTMSLAFMAAVSLVVREVSWLAFWTVYIGIISLSGIWIASLVVVLLIESRTLVLRQVIKLVFWNEMLFYSCKDEILLLRILKQVNAIARSLFH